MAYSSKINEDSEFEDDNTFSLMGTNELNSTARATAKFKFNPGDAINHKQNASPQLVTAKNFNLKPFVSTQDPNLNKTSNMVSFRD